MKLIISFVLTWNCWALLPNDSGKSANEQGYKTVTWSMIKEDIADTFKILGRASYLQFTTFESLYIGAAGALTLSHAFDYDDHYVRVLSRQDPGGWVDAFNTVGTLTTFPILPGYLYYLAYKRQDKKLYEFTKELTALTYLTLGESFIFSFIDIHERPSTDDLNKFETEFRGDSSFVSGHILPLTALTYKSFQFYGAKYAIAPAILTLIQSYQRVHDKKHFMSDIVGAYLFVALGDIGVRKANRKGESLEEKTSYFQIYPSYNQVYGRFTYLF